MTFTKFLDKEINTFTKRTFYLTNHAALVNLTITKWNNIRPLIKKLNPSAERVRETLDNIEAAELILLSVLQDWLLNFAPETAERIYSMCYRIWQAIVALAQYGYTNIYNEVEDQQEVEHQAIIDQYNDLFQRFIETLDSCIDELQSGLQSIIRPNELKSKNDSLVRNFLSVLRENPGFESGESDDEQ